MSIDTQTAGLIDDIDKALALAATGIRNPEKMKQAQEEMTRLREDLRKRIGTIEQAVELVRDARN